MSYRAAILLQATFLSWTCLAQQSKISPDLDLSKTEPTEVIVQYSTTPTEKHLRHAARVGARLNRSLELIHGHQFTVAGTAIQDLANDPDVIAIHPDRTLRGSLDMTAAAVNAPTAWAQGYDATGVGVAVIDSGISPNDHNQQNYPIAYAEDFTGSGSTLDVYGHGSHVAGIISSRGIGWYANGTSTNTNYVGIARGAKIINLRVLDQTGSGKDSWVIAAINRAIQLKSQYNIRVINLSLGRPFATSYKTDPLCTAVEAAWNAGIVVVVAAGNDGRNNTGANVGYGTINAPGNDPYVITVGAMKSNGTASRTDDTIASYSSKGPTLIDHVVKPDLVAPGNRVLSDAGWNYQSQSTLGLSSNEIWHYNYSLVAGPLQQFMRLSGTSMATPVVSAAAAILIQKDPTLTPDQVKARLMKTAYKQFPGASTAVDAATGTSYTSYYDVFTVGAGYLDIAAALGNTEKIAAKALSPAVKKNSDGSTSLDLAVSNGSSVAWGTSVAWGSSVSWGTSVIWGTGNLRSTSVIWGTNSVAGNSVIWGTATSAVSPTSVIWGSNTVVADAAMAILVNGDK